KRSSTLSGSLTHNSSSPETQPDIPTHSPLSCMFLSASLQTALHALIPAYTGPFLIICRSPHTFLLQHRTKTDSFSVLRLKPTFLHQMQNLHPLPKLGRPPSHPLPPPISILKSPSSSLPKPSHPKKVFFQDPPTRHSFPLVRFHPRMKLNWPK
ncbi:MAG: hypothetical protein ACK56I_27365, partial [bacterium]